MITVWNGLLGTGRPPTVYFLCLLTALVATIILAMAILSAPLGATAVLLLFFPALLLIGRPALLALGYVALLPLLQNFGTRVSLVESGVLRSLNLMGAANMALLGCGLIALFLYRDAVAWRVLWPVVAFPLYLLATTAFSPELMVSARNWVAYAVSAVLALLISADREPQRLLRGASAALLVCGSITGVMGLWQLGTWDLTFEFAGMPRVTGAQGHPNAHAMVLVVTILAAVVTSAHVRLPVRRIQLWCSAVALTVLLLFTFSRTGWIAFAVCLGVAFLMMGNRLVGWGLVALCLLAPLSLEIVPLLVSRFEPDASLYLRFELIEWGLDAFSEAPLLGHGVGTFTLLSVGEFGPLGDRYGVQMGITPHNDSIRFLVEGGVIGFSLYVYLMIYLSRFGLRLARLTGSLQRGLGIFLTSIISGTVVFGMAGQGFSYSAPYLLSAVGLAAAIARSSGEPRRASPALQVPYHGDAS